MSDVGAQELSAQELSAQELSAQELVTQGLGAQKVGVQERAHQQAATGPGVSEAQRGLVTVEFIFGIILVIAIITVVVSVIHNPAIGNLLVQLVSWILGLVKGVKA